MQSSRSDDRREPRQTGSTQHRVLEGAQERRRSFRGDQDRAGRVVCGKHYVFGGMPTTTSTPAPLPANLQRDDQVEAAVADKEAGDDAAVVVAGRPGVKPVRIVYQDGARTPPSPAGRTSTRARPRRSPAASTVITLDIPRKPLPRCESCDRREAPAPAATPVAASAPPAAAPPDRRNATGAFAVRLPQRGGVKSFFGLGEATRSPAGQGVRAAQRSDRRAAAAQTERRARRARAAGLRRPPEDKRGLRSQWRGPRARGRGRPRHYSSSRLLHHQERRLWVAGWAPCPAGAKAEAGEQALVFAERKPHAQRHPLKARRRASASPAASRARAIPRPRQAGNVETRPIWSAPSFSAHSATPTKAPSISRAGAAALGQLGGDARGRLAERPGEGGSVAWLCAAKASRMRLAAAAASPIVSDRIRTAATSPLPPRASCL